MNNTMSGLVSRAQMIAAENAKRAQMTLQRELSRANSNAAAAIRGKVEVETRLAAAQKELSEARAAIVKMEAEVKKLTASLNEALSKKDKKSKKAEEASKEDKTEKTEKAE